MNIKNLHPEYITNEKGEKQSVILPISDYQELIEDIEDLAALAERRNEPNISHEEMIKELKRDGIV